MALTISANSSYGTYIGRILSLDGGSTRVVSNAGTPNTRIEYTITGGVSPSSGGKLVNTNTSANINVGDKFTQSQLIAGVIGVKVNEGIFIPELKFTMSAKDLDDPSSPPVSLTITIRLQYPAMPPHQVNVGDLSVPEDQSVKLSGNTILYDDVNAPNSPELIFYVIQTLPAYGYLMKNGVKMKVGDTFTQKDVNSGIIEYKHDLSIDEEADKDEFILLPRDLTNKTADPVTINVNIRLTDLPLMIQRNGPLVMDMFQEETIGNSLLRAIDMDDLDLTITYTVVRPPLCGILKLDGVQLLDGGTFTQADVNSGKLKYEHVSEECLNDEFTYNVAHSKNTLENNPAFQITIIPNYPPRVTTKPITVQFCKGEAITEDYISIEDPEGLPPSQLKITITSLPEFGELLLNGAQLSVGSQFTYADILAGSLIYKHLCTAHVRLTDPFNFTVQDDASEVEATMDVIIEMIYNSPPYMVKNTTHMVKRTSTTVFNFGDFDFDDEDTPYNEVYLEITELPQHGTLLVDGSPVDVGSKWSRHVWESLTFTYDVDLDDPDYLIEEDFFEFKLLDGFNEVEGLQKFFKFPPLPLECPDLLNEGMSVTMKTTRAISEAELAATSEYVGPEDLVFTVTKLPNHGELRIKGNPAAVKMSFTMEDVRSLQVEYEHKVGEPDSDTFEFTVTDGVCDLSGEFMIHLIKGLKLITNEVLHLNQGETGTIDRTLLFAESTLETDPSKIVFSITGGPLHGRILINGEPLDSFTQKDINDGIVWYEHDDNNSYPDDVFNFVVTDGFSTISAEFLIEIVLDDNEPELVNNGLTLPELTCRNITYGALHATDIESSGLQLVFTLKSLPENGYLHIDGSVLDEVEQTFTQHDIDAGKLQYCHEVEATETDSFDFELRDSYGHTIEDTFNITIIPPAPPSVINVGMDTYICTTKAINGSLLNVTNLRSSVDLDDVVFKITRLPDIGSILIAGQPAEVDETFTLKQLRASEIAYQHYSLEAATTSFDYAIVEGPLLKTGTFEIRVHPGNSPPWVCVNTGMWLTQGTTKVIGIESLQMCDIDLDAQGEILNPTPIDEMEYDETYGEPRAVSFGVEPGQTYAININVESGSVKVLIRDVASKVLLNTDCIAAYNSPAVRTFKAPPMAYEVSVRLEPGCVSGNAEPKFTVTATKES